MTPERAAAAHWSIHAATAPSQGRRSSSVSGWPAFILAMLAAGCRSSPSSNSQPSSPANREPIVVLPLPATPATTTIIEPEPPSLVGQPAGLSCLPPAVLMAGAAHRRSSAEMPAGAYRGGMTSSARPPGHAAPHGADGTSVLVVEDDPGIATQLVRGLSRSGY